MTGSRRLRRALLSALAGSGLTVAGLAGPAAAPIAAEATTSAEKPPEPTATSPGAETTPTQPVQPANTTSTTTAPPASTVPAPPPAQTQTATAPSATPQSSTPAVQSERTQETTRGEAEGTQAQTGGTSPAPLIVEAAPSVEPSQPSPGASNVAPPPQGIAAQPGALSALLAGSASGQALRFFQVPLFLLPIYQAAATQYGVPWEILAAINEVETNYGTDLSVSSAGAVGWMQFMPETWSMYGVDALDAGYADPYNPVDAIFAAARYLRAAGAAKNLRAAIFSYNHSEDYVNSVLLRARLLASYPPSVIATLTGLTDGRLPVIAGRLPSTANAAQAPASASSATAGASLAPAGVAPPPSRSGQSVASQPARLLDLYGPSGAGVIAVEDGRVTAVGHSRRLGRYLTLRDVYGDVFTYAGLGSVVSAYRLAKSASAVVPGSVRTGAETVRDPKPSSPASAGSHPNAANVQQGTSGANLTTPARKVRLFADPQSPYARAAAARALSHPSRAERKGWAALRRGAVLTQGTLLGHLGGSSGQRGAHLRFAIAPAGDQGTVDPLPILENWQQLGRALHPRGAKGDRGLIGANDTGVFLLTKGELERAVLSDPGIGVEACARHQIASGKVESHVLAALLFLSRNGLKPTVSALRCGQGQSTLGGVISPQYAGAGVDISAVNGVPVAGHQGAGTLTDLTIRALLTLQGRFAPTRIVSLTRYPGAPNTFARSDHAHFIEVDFLPARGGLAPNPSSAVAAARHAHGAKVASRVALGGQLSPAQWQRLIQRIGELPVPKILTKPSSAAIRDPRPHGGQTRPGANTQRTHRG